VRFDGEYQNDYAGWVVGLGDINADGYSDVSIVTMSTLALTSRAYVVLGEPDPPERLNLGQLGERGFTIRGVEGNWFSAGYGAMAAGDMDGDGLLDLAIGESTPKGKRVIVIFGVPPSSVLFIRGDTNDDKTVDLSDAVFVLTHLFLGGLAPPCDDAADADDNGTIEITDAIYLLGHLFLGRIKPPAPFPERGEDPTADALGCGGVLRGG